MKNTAFLPNKSPVEKAILKTVLYSDIFQFPLTKDEIWQYVISRRSIAKATFDHALSHLRVEGKLLSYKDGYYCLTGQEATITERKKNMSEVAIKMHLAGQAAYYLAYLPTITFIGISGGVAMGNATKDADVDFFIITKKNTLFMTRLWILAILEVMKLRRVREEKNPANKICVNLLIEETALTWPTTRQDLYTAHEIAQVKPLFERNGMYQRFLDANLWITKFLPNATEQRKNLPMIKKRTYITLSILHTFFQLLPFELVVRSLQKRAINRYRTRELVENNILAFHPVDYGSKTMRVLRQRMHVLGLLTKGWILIILAQI